MKNKVIIIAEAGVNHNGDINKAKKLIEIAAKSGADYVKFQTFKAEKLVTKFANKAEYQKENTGNDGSQYEMLKKYEISEPMHKILMEHCKKNNIKFLTTAFDIESLNYIHSLGIKLAKIPSGEITNLPYLREVAKKFDEIILSTGMSNMSEIISAYKVLNNNPKKEITILHCNTDYPTKFDDVNLMAMQTIQSCIKSKVGYSDHTLGIEVAVAAVALGANVIEKHFTIDRNLEGPDHKASLEPNELNQMVKSIRNIELAMAGSGKKIPSKSEFKNIKIARKSIVAKQNIKKGEIFSFKNLTVKRPGSGISPMLWDSIIGLKSKRNYFKDELIDKL